jgi:alkylation response protein AidB-like acyl-CoA dehydrogenase
VSTPDRSSSGANPSPAGRSPAERERPDDASFAAAVRDALRARLVTRDPDEPVVVLGAGNEDLEPGREYLHALADGGWAVPMWPVEHGGLGLDPKQAAAVNRELAAFRVPDLYPFMVGLALVGPTLVAHATAAQCRRWLPAIRRGDEIWCQLFSEPGAGSDLAGLRCRAVRDGDAWRVSGQKVWSSRAHYSAWGLLLARTDPTLPKHAGITAFALRMDQPGVEVRPLRQMNGDAHFNEVFLDDAVVDDADRIDDVGAGWPVALTCLAHERGALGGGGPGLSFERLVDLARRRGSLDDVFVRDALARTYVDMEVARLGAKRARDLAGAGRPGPEGSGMKLRFTETFRRYADTALRILGPEAVAAPGEWSTLFLTSPSMSIRGGTDEIQRNIVGERVLGLPGDVRVDRDVPFDELPG